MLKWLKNIVRRIPSGKAIAHVVIIEIFLELIWNWFSGVITIILVREIGFIVVFVAGLFAVAWYLPKLSPRWSGATDIREKLQREPKPHTPWLEEILKTDRQQLVDRMKIQKLQWSWNGIDDINPYIEVIVPFVNASVFSVLVIKTDGSFIIEGSRCNLPTSMEGQRRIPRADTAYIRIRQLLLREVADIAIKKREAHSTLNIDLSACYLYIQSEEPEHRSEPVALKVGRDYKIEIPK